MKRGESMPNYVEIPFISSDEPYECYAHGVELFTTPVGTYRITAYNTGIDLSDKIFRAGVVRNGNGYVVYIWTNWDGPWSPNYVITNPALSVYKEVQGAHRDPPRRVSGYINNIDIQFNYTVNFAVTVFGNEMELFPVIASDTDPVGPDSGVVVTAIASPLAPDLDGVVVYATAQLLDPNQQGGTSTPGGGTGTFDDTSDEIPVSTLPDISAANAGLVTLFRPSNEQLIQLGDYLWTGVEDFIENLNKIFTNPMDYIIALNIFPCVPSVGAERPIKIGSFTTQISMPPVLSQWYEHNCGTVLISEYWGSALDYAPNTKVSLVLPFIGNVQLNTDEVMGRQIGVRYRIDLLSGQCVAMVTVDNSVYYQYTGECSVSVPLTASDWSRIYTAAIGAIGTLAAGGISAVGAASAAGGATAALAGSRASEAISMAGQNFAMINETSKGIKGVQEMREHMIEAAQIASNAAKQAASAPSRVGKAIRMSRIANTVNNTVGAVMSGKVHIQHSGTISGSAGMLGIRTPYIMIEFPNQSLADNYRHFVGYPSNMYANLLTLRGYTECEQVLINIPGTDDELSELVEALKGGVYL